MSTTAHAAIDMFIDASLEELGQSGQTEDVLRTIRVMFLAGLGVGMEYPELAREALRRAEVAIAEEDDVPLEVPEQSRRMGVKAIATYLAVALRQWPA